MSKSKQHNKDTIKDYEEQGPRRKRKVQVDKYKERRIQRALKTKNVQEFIYRFDESIDLDPLERE